jgi:hypothetical protein
MYHAGSHLHGQKHHVLFCDNESNAVSLGTLLYSQMDNRGIERNGVLYNVDVGNDKDHCTSQQESTICYI